MAERILRNYIILGEIGSGGMAVVYQGIQLSLNRSVAIKKIHPHLLKQSEYVKRFEREAKTLATLDHQNIVSIIDYGEDKNAYFIVMQYIDGISLRDVISEVGALPLEISLGIIEQVINGISYAHQKGIIHRDIKPGNILINKDGTVKIADFGLSRFQDDTTLTRTGVSLGSPHYMAPEQLTDEIIDNQADIYSTGLVLFEMLTGKKGLEGDSPSALIKKQVLEGDISLSEHSENIPDGLKTILSKAIAKLKNKRYRTAAEFLGGIQEFSKRDGLETSNYHIERFLSEKGLFQIRPEIELENLDEEFKTEILAEEKITESSKRRIRKPIISKKYIGLAVGSTVIITFLILFIVRLSLADQRILVLSQKIEELQTDQVYSLPSEFGEEICNEQKCSKEVIDLLIEGDEALKVGDFKRSEKKYFSVSQLLESPKLEFLLGTIRLALEKNESAILAFDRAIEMDPEYGQAYNNRALAKYYVFGAEKYGEVIQDLDRMIEINPELPEGYNNRGLVRTSSREYQSAIDDFGKAIEIKPDMAEAFNNRGLAYNALGYFDRAVEEYSMAIKHKTDFVDAYWNRAKLYQHKLENNWKALKDYDKIIELDPTDYQAINNRALIKCEMGDEQGALDDFILAIEIEPNYKLSYLNAAETALICDKPEQALNYAERATKRFDLTLSEKAPILLIAILARKEMGEDSNKYETEFRSICREDFGCSWDFERLDKWINKKPEEKIEEYKGLRDLVR
ncbi:protein kinase [bacterium]|nr:protein kinase [bacterium]